MTDSAVGMDTTCGAVALQGAKARNAPVIERLLEAGVIIIGKANLSVSQVQDDGHVFRSDVEC